MSRPVNLYDAKTHLSDLVDRAANGEEIVIAKSGLPLARLVPFKKRPPRRRGGFLKGKIRTAKDFDAPLPPEILAPFIGRGS